LLGYKWGYKLIFALFIPPKGAAMLTDAKVRKIKPLEKRAKYADEKVCILRFCLLVACTGV
jgi:hypothetical protein